MYLCTALACVYADNILLVARSVHMLQEMSNCYETELMRLDMLIILQNSACIRFDPRYDADCFQLLTADDDINEWVDYIRYLGV